MSKTIGLLAALALLAGLACGEPPEPQPLPTATPTVTTPTATATASPTAAPTPRPTPTATPEPTWDTGERRAGYRPTRLVTAVKDRDLCDEDRGPTGDATWPDGARVVVHRIGSAECAGWVQVRQDIASAPESTWVRAEWLADPDPAIVTALGAWQREDYRSRYSDSLVTSLHLTTRNARTDDRYGAESATLILRCGHEGAGLEAVVFWEDDLLQALRDRGTAEYRLDDGPSVRIGWSEASNKRAAFLEGAWALANGLARSDRLRLRLAEYDGSLRDADFNIRGFHRVSSHLGCYR